MDDNVKKLPEEGKFNKAFPTVDKAEDLRKYPRTVEEAYEKIQSVLLVPTNEFGGVLKTEGLDFDGVTHEQKFEFIDNLDFGKALEAMKRGHKVRRTSWFNKSFYIYIGPVGENVPEDLEYREIYCNSQNQYSGIDVYRIYESKDILANDWEIILE